MLGKGQHWLGNNMYCWHGTGTEVCRRRNSSEFGDSLVAHTVTVLVTTVRTHVRSAPRK